MLDCLSCPANDNHLLSDPYRGLLPLATRENTPWKRGHAYVREDRAERNPRPCCCPKMILLAEISASPSPVLRWGRRTCHICLSLPDHSHCVRRRPLCFARRARVGEEDLIAAAAWHLERARTARVDASTGGNPDTWSVGSTPTSLHNVPYPAYD